MSKGSDFEKLGSKLRKGFYIFFKILFSFNSVTYHVLWLKFLQIIFSPIDIIFALIEKSRKIKSNKEISIIFVVGIQRTGSTLVSQFIEKTFSFFPIGNFNTIFKRSNYYLHKQFVRKYKSNNSYKNFYGISKGLFSIGDSYEVWDKWFGKNHYVLPTEIGNEKLENLSDYFSSLYEAYNKPILSKNNRNSLLLPILRKVFKNGFYIIVKRDPVAVIKSTIKASKDFFGTDSILWGLYPDMQFDTNNYENITEAATVQFLMLDKILNEQIKELDQNSYLIVDYDQFCQDPFQFQQNLINILKTKLEFKIENVQYSKESFKTSKRLINMQLDEQIKSYIDIWKNKV
ncbi:MAG: sulfotransferase [Bacteroidales bacterium]|nr:sulfotransferase [Bacteroidales bacterium]